MQIKKLAIGVITLSCLAVLSLGGCSKSDKQATEPNADQGGAPTAMQGGPNNATLINDLQARLKEKPNDASVYWALGDAYLESRQYNEAVDNYKKAIEITPNESDIYNELGLALHYLGRSPEALKYIEEGIKKNPYNQRIWLTKGFITAYGMADLEGAKAAWEKARALNPESQVGKAAAEYLAQLNKK